MNSKTHVLFMMGGSGTRFGSNLPKQFVRINNTPIFIFPLLKYEKMDTISSITIACNKLFVEDTIQYCKDYNLTKVKVVTKGGDTRSESVKNGLAEIKRFADGEDVILIHDATHPFVDIDCTNRLIKEIEACGAGSLVNFIFDTAYIKDENDFLVETIDRKKLAVGASPEGFLFKYLDNIYSNTPKEQLEMMTSAGALALHFGIKMKVIEINLLNLKITYPRDMELYQLLIDYYIKEKE